MNNEKKVMYRLCKWTYTKIEDFEVTKLSDKSVWFINSGQPCVQLLETKEHKWFSHKEEAIEEAYEALQSGIFIKKEQLEEAQKDLREFEKKYVFNNCQSKNNTYI